MFSPEYIAAMSRDAAAKAAAEGLYPFTIEQEDLDLWKIEVAAGRAPTLPFPVLGNLDPEGWDETDEMFVDSLGWDLEDSGGPALSIGSLIRDKLKVGHGYAIGDTGQFQLYVREFKHTA